MKFKSKDEALTARIKAGDSEEVAQKWVDENCDGLPDVIAVKESAVKDYVAKTDKRLDSNDETVSELYEQVKGLTDELDAEKSKNAERDAIMKDLNGNTLQATIQTNEDFHKMKFGYENFADLAMDISSLDSYHCLNYPDVI